VLLETRSSIADLNAVVVVVDDDDDVVIMRDVVLRNAGDAPKDREDRQKARTVERRIMMTQ